MPRTVLPALGRPRKPTKGVVTPSSSLTAGSCARPLPACASGVPAGAAAEPAVRYDFKRAMSWGDTPPDTSLAPGPHPEAPHIGSADGMRSLRAFLWLR